MPSALLLGSLKKNAENKIRFRLEFSHYRQPASWTERANRRAASAQTRSISERRSQTRRQNACPEQTGAVNGLTEAPLRTEAVRSVGRAVSHAIGVTRFITRVNHQNMSVLFRATCRRLDRRRKNGSFDLLKHLWELWRFLTKMYARWLLFEETYEH